MANENENKKSSKISGVFRWISKHLVLVGILAVLAAIGVSAIGFGTSSRSDLKTSELTFHDLGDLTTQEAVITQVSVLENSRAFYGVSIPFTTSKSIYSYDVKMKAAVDFTNVVPDVGEEEIDGERTTVYTVPLPKAKVTDCYIDNSTFKLYEENESLFTNMGMELQNEDRVKLENDAKEKAINDGFLDRADEQAKKLITAFLNQITPDCEVRFTEAETVND